MHTVGRAASPPSFSTTTLKQEEEEEGGGFLEVDDVGDMTTMIDVMLRIDDFIRCYDLLC